MSSMGNSQDDAQHSSSTNKKLNPHFDQNSIPQNLNQDPSKDKHSGQKAHKSAKPIRSIKDVSEKLNEPLLGAPKSKTTPQANQAVPAMNKAVINRSNQPPLDRLSQFDGPFDVAHPRVAHPDFNAQTKQAALDPDRPLSDIPSPTARYNQPLQQLFNQTASDNKGLTTIIHEANQRSSAETYQQSQYDKASMWALIASPELASHLELLQLGGLINLPAAFFEPVTTAHESADTAAKDTGIKQPLALLSPLTKMTLLDMSDIHRVCAAYPSLTRYGFKTNETRQAHRPVANMSQLSASMPEMINDIFAPNWELILYPERFDNGVDSLATDILACSVAVHILKQCQTRQTVNRSVTAQQICQHMRSYVLSQCNIHPQFEAQYRQIRLFVGHVIVAAHYLGFKITHADHHDQASHVNDKGEPSANLGQPIYLNMSSRSALLVRYPNISDYYINGWS